MASVETVGGPIAADDLGTTYMHEHIFILTPEVQANFPDEWGSEEARVQDAVEKLRALAGQGVRTIVDLTVLGHGRDVPRIQRIAQQVPELNIVVSTGCYTLDVLPLYFRFRGPAVSQLVGRALPEPMVDMFVRDIEEGIAGTGVKAGMLKCAIDYPGLTPDVERVMRAVAQAHQRTGTPITVHTYPESRSGWIVKRVMCDEEGVDPGSIVLGHSGDSTDVEHLVELAEAGFVLGMDRFGSYVTTTFEKRADTVVEMCRRGHAGQMVLSHDAACYIDCLDPQLPPQPKWNYLHIADDLLPYLREQGVSERVIGQMLVDVPQRVLPGTTPPNPREA